MNKDKIRYLVLSDIHLGHRKNKTINIIENLDLYFMENDKLFQKLDIIFIAGDIYDTLLNHSNPDVQLITGWLIRLALYCKKNDIKLRILEGTPSHDWKQAANIETIIKEANIDIDFKYIKDVYIEEMMDLGLNVLYVPDEVRHNSKEVFEIIEKVMKAKGLKQVDITIMHGQFHYQLPGITLESSHNEDDFLRITKYFISPGHIHKHSVYNRIIAQGSFDRLAHNEEENKGGVLITLDKTDLPKFRFIKNRRAKIFKTIVIKDGDIDRALAKLKEEILRLPEDSHVALKMDILNPLRSQQKYLKEFFKDYNITIKQLKEEDNKKDLLEEQIVESKVINITPKNIKDLLLEEIENEIKLENDFKNIFEDELDNILKNI